MYRIRLKRRFMPTLLTAALVLSPLGGGVHPVYAAANPIALKVDTDLLEYNRGVMSSISILGDDLNLSADAEELRISLTYDGDIFDTSYYTSQLAPDTWEYRSDESLYNLGIGVAGKATMDAPIVVDNGDGTYTIKLVVSATIPDDPITVDANDILLDLIMDVKSDAPIESTSISITAVSMKSNDGATTSTNLDAGVFSLTPAVVSVVLPDEEAVAEDKQSLSIGYAANESAAGVMNNITLPLQGVNGTTVAWSSSHPAIISAGGVVQPPAVGQGNAAVTMTATITKGNEVDTREFSLTVLEQTLSDSEAVAQAKQALQVGYALNEDQHTVKSGLTLPVSGSHGTAISWSSDKPSAVSADGTVTRPAFSAGDETVTLTATLSKGTASDTQTFTVKVLRLEQTDEEAVVEARDALTIGYEPGDSMSAVKQNVTLPLSGLNGTTVSWDTTAAELISSAGIVNRPANGAGNQNVTLTASVSRNGVTRTQPFQLTVLEQVLSDADAVNQAKDALQITFSPGDTKDAVTGNVTLPSIGLHDTVITWSSAPSDLVSDTGVVTRPAFTSGDQDVQLTATITKNGAETTRIFPLHVVKADMTDGEAVAADKAALTIGLQAGDEPISVTGDVTLPLSGLNGATISWASDKEDAISTAGHVVRPSYGSGNATVTMTATIQKGQALDTQVFTMTVLEAAQQPNTGGGSSGDSDNDGGSSGGSDNDGGSSGGSDNDGSSSGGSDNGSGSSGGSDNDGGSSGGSDNGSGGGSSTGTSTSTPTAPSSPAPTEKTPSVPVPDRTGVFNSNVLKSDTNVEQSILKRVEEARQGSIPHMEAADTKGHWAEKTLDLFMRLNVIQGYEDRTAKPDQAISRAEFVSILSRIFQVSGSEQVSLQDVNTHWAAEAIQQFAGAGIIGGYGDGTFQPDRTISREEIVVIMSRLVNLKQTTKDTDSKPFQDVEDSYAKDAIYAAAETGIIQGKEAGKFEPNNSSTRAEALQIILNTLNLNPEIKTLLDSLK